MKSKLQISAGIFLFLAFSLAGSLAQSPAAPNSTVFPMVDPNTGLPLPPPPPEWKAPEWKDPNWKDPDVVLTNVFYNGLPLSEIARDLRDRFNGDFDVLLPAPTSGENTINRLTGLPISTTDWAQTSVELQLRNVTASEVFNAMNLIFENDETPLRWELKVNGHRQLALLRVLVGRNPSYPSKQVEEVRRIYFVGDLIGDEKSGGMSMEQIIKTVTDVWQMADAPGGKIQFHKDAQLLVVSGSLGQIDFMEQTLKALRLKVERQRYELSQSERPHSPSLPVHPKINAPTSPASGN